MKRTINLLMPLFFITVLAACNKDSNTYSVTDHTTGMIKNRVWSGFSYGYIVGDTIVPAGSGGVDTLAWPKYFHHITTDSTFSILKINGFAINVAGAVLIYRSENVNDHILRFDSTYANAGTASFLLYNYVADTMHFEYHKNTGYNTQANRGYEFNQVLSSSN